MIAEGRQQCPEGTEETSLTSREAHSMCLALHLRLLIIPSQIFKELKGGAMRQGFPCCIFQVQGRKWPETL